MSIQTIIPAELVHEVQERLEKAARGIRDSQEMRNACEAMDKMREELRQRIGTVNVAVDLVRETRDQ